MVLMWRKYSTGQKNYDTFSNFPVASLCPILSDVYNQLTDFVNVGYSTEGG